MADELVTVSLAPFLRCKDLSPSEPSDICLAFRTAHPSFNITRVIEVSNDATKDVWRGGRAFASFENGGDANVQRLFHGTGIENIRSLALNGFDMALCKPGGYLGTGLYFSDNPFKANDFSPCMGDPVASRAIIVCNVVLGRIFHLGIGGRDKSIKAPPPGFHSFQTFIRRATEWAVYRERQVDITHIVLYSFPDTSAETAAVYDVPKGCTGKTFFITAALSEFLTKLKLRAEKKDGTGDNHPTPCSDAMAELAGQFLRNRVRAADFLSAATAILKTDPPKADTIDKLRREMERSGLTIDKADSGDAQASPARVDDGDAVGVETDNTVYIY